MTVTERAYAKLNISLDVTGKRPDGYHEMRMVMQTVSLCDQVTVAESGSKGITASSNLSYIPSDSRNLAVKAAELYFRKLGEPCPGLTVSIRKEIPVGAGMAGGSADAAAVLRALNAMTGGKLSREKLLETAAETGSDVPFCLCGGTMLATGRGEILQRIAPMPDCFYVICKPSFSVSTPELFRRLDGVRLRCHPDTEGLVGAAEKGDLREVCRRMYNVFEDAGDGKFRTVREIKSTLLQGNALGAIMTGTGSAVFGVFEDRATAEKMCRALKKSYGFACVAENVETLYRDAE